MLSYWFLAQSGIHFDDLMINEFQLVPKSIDSTDTAISYILL